MKRIPNGNSSIQKNAGSKINKKKILVTGDLIIDNNLSQTQYNHTYHTDTPPVLIDQVEGGAWYLSGLIESICGEYAEVYKPPADWRNEIKKGSKGSPYHQAFQMWSLSDEGPDELIKKKVMRISHFLGCKKGAPTAGLYAYPSPGMEMDLVMLDDLGLGFFDDDKLWPPILQKKTPPAHTEFFIKTSRLSGHSALWLKLLQPEWAGRITVFVSVDMLRQRGAPISKGLSWDRTIEELTEEFTTGISSYDLAKCRRVYVLFGCDGVALFTKDRFKFKGAGDHQKLQFDRMLYDPEHGEGTWIRHRPGISYGGLSILAASIVLQALCGQAVSFYVSGGSALAAIRFNHKRGAGESDLTKFDTMKSKSEIIKWLTWWIDRKIELPAFWNKLNAEERRTEKRNRKQAQEKEKEKYRTDVFKYASAFPRYQRRHPRMDCPALSTFGVSRNECDILGDAVGRTETFAFVKAMEIIIRGRRQALPQVPRANFKKLFTVDREEIERLNSIHNMIHSYLNNPNDLRPLSIAVFGSPGSGKSFAIKQMNASSGGLNELEFDLSQFMNEKDLHDAFHQVHDHSVKNRIPIVFWDEFDTKDLDWLKHFLAPMHDANFFDGSTSHPFGKSIFIFAGGTCESFKIFSKPKGKAEQKKFKDKKGPDFVSRLRGHLNIKGPNTLETLQEKNEKEKDRYNHLIRRAIIIRAELEKSHPHIINPATGYAAIDPAVVAALLKVNRYEFGARSIGAIISMCHTGETKNIGMSALPSDDLISMHATQDFKQHLAASQLENSFIETISKATHEKWRHEKERQGWRRGEKRDDKTKRHPLLKPYENLSEKDKEANRQTARLVQAKLSAIGLEIMRTPKKSRLPVFDIFDPKNNGSKKTFLCIEHEIWLRSHLLDGYEYHIKGNDDLRLHTDIAYYNDISSDNKRLNVSILEAQTAALKKGGYRIVRKSRHRRRPSA